MSVKTEHRQPANLEIEIIEADPDESLRPEFTIYQCLQGSVGIPRLHWYGMHAGKNALVVDLLGPSLKELFLTCNRRFSLKTVLMLAHQMIDIVEYMHMKNFIHGHLKPSNFLMGTGSNCDQLFITSLKSVKEYCDPLTLEHIPYQSKKHSNGNVWFSSINGHWGIPIVRRDDMESLGYILIYFNSGTLPWLECKSETLRQTFERVKELKMSTSVEALCQGVPSEFAVFIKFCRYLRFDQEPDYKYLRQLFLNLFRKQNYKYDCNFDWKIANQTPSDKIV